MLGYERFCAALGIEPDTYAAEKYDDVKALAKALARVSPQHLAQLTSEPLCADCQRPRLEHHLGHRFVKP